MSPSALVALMVVAGVCHASWNLLTKATVADRVLMIASLSAVIAGLSLPWAVLNLPTDWWPLLPIVGGRALAQCLYAFCLGRAYAQVDLSLAYPLARGTGPVIATGLSVLLLAERPGPIGIAGVVLVSLGIVSLTLVGPHDAWRVSVASGAGWAVLTGVIIGVYSVIDKAGVAHADALTYLCMSEGLTALLFGGVLLARGQGDRFGPLLRRHWRRVVIAGVLAAAGYGFALIAMTHTYVSYIAPLREISVLFAVVLSGLFLKEAGALHRIPSAVVIVTGVVLVGLAL